MNIGMLWFDNSTQSFTDKVTQAAQYYQDKHGQPPNLCFVNPADAVADTVGGITIRSSKQILRSHFWMGVESQAEVKG